MFEIIYYILICFGLPVIIVYLKEKRNALNSENKNIKYFIKKFFWINFTFNGRINRYEFLIYGGWFFWGITMPFFGACIVIAETTGNELITIPAVIIAFSFVLHQYAVYIKRLHDLNKSGWNVLWSFIPILGYIYLAIICFFFKGIKGSNDYGSDPNDNYQEKSNPLKNIKNKSNNTFSDMFPNSKNKIKKRLAELKQLLDDNSISKEEYEKQRKKIIGDV
ncbi:DUF805 domain-containing protein [Alphaproteobacteria bacterium]|nr:DUF805 domain-containing protein [Alphaproteobacteria bacterium]